MTGALSRLSTSGPGSGGDGALRRPRRRAQRQATEPDGYGASCGDRDPLRPARGQRPPGHPFTA
jgi:hypothetical protein